MEITCGWCSDVLEERSPIRGIGGEVRSWEVEDELEDSEVPESDCDTCEIDRFLLFVELGGALSRLDEVLVLCG